MEHNRRKIKELLTGKKNRWEKKQNRLIPMPYDNYSHSEFILYPQLASYV